MAGQYDHFVGELTPGQHGWLPLDENGTPIGPATIQAPIGPNAMACSVVCNSITPLPSNQDLLLSSSGAPITDHMQSNVDKRTQPYEAPDQEPVIESLEPAFVSIGSPDFDLVVHGDNFTEQSVINFAGHDEPTTFADGTVTTVVKPSLWQAPDIVQVIIKNGTVSSGPVDFEFTDAGGARRSDRR
jgi:hypothetical protein